MEEKDRILRREENASPEYLPNIEERMITIKVING